MLPAPPAQLSLCLMMREARCLLSDARHGLSAVRAAYLRATHAHDL